MTTSVRNGAKRLLLLAWHRYECQERPEEHRESDGEEDEDVRDPLLTDAQKLRLLARRRSL